MPARKIDGWWYADFRVLGKRHRKRSPANTRAEAQRFEQYLRKEIALHGTLDHLSAKKPHAVAEKVPTFAQFSEDWIRTFVVGAYRASEQRQRASVVRSRLVPEFGRHRMDQITCREIEEFKSKLQRSELSRKTINNHLTILRACLITAKVRGFIKEVPPFKILRLGDPPPFAYLQPHEASALVDAMPAGLWRAMVTVALRTGMRYSELVALRWEDVDFAAKRICIQRAEVRGCAGPTKNRRIRYVPMSREVCNTLNGMKPTQGRVFSFLGRSVPYQRAWIYLNNGCKDAGVRVVSWHDLRHTFATDLACRGVPIHVVQKLLGHTAIQMTLRYTHLYDQSLEDAIARLDTVSGGQQLGDRGELSVLDANPDRPFRTMISA